MRIEKKEPNKILFYATPEEFEMVLSCFKPIELFCITELLEKNLDHVVLDFARCKFIVVLEEASLKEPTTPE